MEIEYENVKSYIFFLSDKYAEEHSLELREMCCNHQLLLSCSVVKLLTFCLAFFEQRFEPRSFIVVALDELLQGSYEHEPNNKGVFSQEWAHA